MQIICIRLEYLKSYNYVLKTPKKQLHQKSKYKHVM